VKVETKSSGPIRKIKLFAFFICKFEVWRSHFGRDAK